MKYLEMFEKFKSSDNDDEIKENILDIFYEFGELTVDVFKRGDDYTVIIRPKEVSIPDSSSDIFRTWNYFENKGDLNARLIQLFNYMESEDFVKYLHYDRILGDPIFIDMIYDYGKVRPFDKIYMTINTPKEKYKNFGEDDKIVKLEIHFKS